MSTEMIEEYQVIVVSNAAELGTLVTQKIREGWQPLGSLLRSDQNGQWAQAVVKVKPVIRRSLKDPLSVTKREP